MLCEKCLFDWKNLKSQVPPAEATYIVIGPQVLGFIPLCEDHANPAEENDPGYECLPITSPEAQPWLSKLLRLNNE